MKFSHGVWTLRDGVQATYPARVHEHRVEGDELVLVSVNRMEPKANINNYAIVLRLSSPLPGVVRVRVRHQLGRRPKTPAFDLDYSLKAPGVRIDEHSEHFSFASGELTLKIHKRPFSIEFFRGGERICQSRHNALGVMKVAGDRDHLLQRLSLGVGERVYGLGERFGPLVKNGQSVEIWNEDPGTETDLSYKSVPFYVTNKGYGVFVNRPGKVDFEVATERVSAVQISVPDNELDYYFIAGKDPKQVIASYSRIAGKPALPPPWSFGLWLSTSFLTDYDEKIVGGMIDGMFERKIPLSVFHFDCLWMREHHWCDFTWDPVKFPDPKAMLARLKERGIKICLWINPYISELSSLFAEGRDRGYFLKNAAGDVYQRDDWQPGIALVDFTNPEATRWYQDKLRALLDMGVDCFKTDFGERIPKDAVYADGSDPERMHNYYAYLYNQAVFSLLESHHGPGGAVVFARSATAGGQKFPVHWGGDCDATFESMAETLRGGLSFGMSGGAFWSHDISGFNATATPALYKRWLAFGLFSSHSRLHGASSYRVPWEFDEESVDVLRSFTEQKHMLMPYIWSAALEAHETSVPVLRAMALEFPDDPGSAYLEQQYMFGERLLVAPVFDEGGRVRYYLPPGTWTDWFSGERVQGGTWREERDVPYSRIPLFVREATLLAVGTRSDRPDYDYTAELALELFALGDGQSASARVESPDRRRRASYRAERSGSVIMVTSQGASGPGPNLLLRGVERAAVESGELLKATGDGMLVRWPDAAKPLLVRL
jgi:alpha-D-xyloside xylohydrolase